MAVPSPRLSAEQAEARSDWPPAQTQARSLPSDLDCVTGQGQVPARVADCHTFVPADLLLPLAAWRFRLTKARPDGAGLDPSGSRKAPERWSRGRSSSASSP